VEKNLLRTHSPTGSAIDLHVRAISDALSAQLPSLGRRARVAAVIAAAALIVVGITGGLAAAGLALLAAVALLAAFRRPYLLGPLVALLLPAGNEVHVLGAHVAPLEAVVGGGAIGYLVRVATRREDFRPLPVDWVFAALVAFIALSTLGPVDDSDRLRELLFWGALGIVFHAVVAHLDGARNVRLLFVALVVSTFVEASLALFEYVDRWSERFSMLNGAIVYPLPKGTLGHPNGLAQFLVLAVLAVLALALAEHGTLRRVGFVVAGAGSLALVVTFSRASWIAFAAGAAVYLLERRTRAPALVAAGIAAAGAGALVLLNAGAIGARISSLFRGGGGGIYDFRIELIRRAARIAADHPLTGAGRFEEAGVYAGRPDLATHPHNLFLGVAVFFGIPAALALAALLVLALRAAWTGFRAGTGATRSRALGFVGVLVALLVNGILEYPFWNRSLTVLIVLALAVAITLDRAVTREVFEKDC
jgi:O-antigen ligase